MLIPTRTAEDLYAGWWQHFWMLGAVPRVLVWDGEGAVGRWRARQPELTAWWARRRPRSKPWACQAFRGTLGTRVLICKPARLLIQPGTMTSMISASPNTRYASRTLPLQT